MQKKNIHKARSSMISKLSKHLKELHLPLNLDGIKTNPDEIFLLINNSKINIVAFSIQTNLKYLTECYVVTLYILMVRLKIVLNYFINYSLN